MASLFDVGESLGSPETWSQTDLGGGEGGAWPYCKLSSNVPLLTDHSGKPHARHVFMFARVIVADCYLLIYHHCIITYTVNGISPNELPKLVTSK